MTHTKLTEQSNSATETVLSILKGLLTSPETFSEDLGLVKVDSFSKDSVLVTVVTLPGGVYSELKRGLGAATERLEEVLGGTVFLIRARVDSGLKKGEKCFRTGPTYADYQESVAADLAAPFHIVDRRSLVREDGSRVEKIILDIKSQKEHAHRFEPMALVFESLFAKKATFQANYY
ncbi:hypothetical protein NEHOM01_0759 [Nematocida homosporus]|uniref:uncharacterized protein n=1 Tax=Nematocida homosporus TaxID=1912981 RepID=UPI00221E4410|nr:uncharacterized protein NEHOM01_0759 [Nematocida homosporus]KAI5185301.1 hypothetical protein NEHOM01_0759 [Nematocida homosporus]